MMDNKNSLIIRSIQFALIPIGIVMLYFIITYQNFLKNNNQIIHSKKQVIIIGDSHSQKAFNDKKINSCLNISQTGESIYFSYWKLKNILASNNNIKTVVIGIGPHTLASYYDEYIDGKYNLQLTSSYFYYLDLRSKFRAFYDNRNQIIQFIKAIYHNNKIGFFIGGYQNNYDHTIVNRELVEKRILQQYHANSRSMYSDTNCEYFEQLIDLCKRYRKQVIIVNTPQHYSYRLQVPEIYNQQMVHKLKDTSIQYLDWSEQQLQENEYLPDGDHVNRQGSEKITEKLKDILETSGR